MKPRLLDLFCGAGGAAMGYHRAGFEPYGIDNKVQPSYQFPFSKMDALEAMDRLLGGECLTFGNGVALYLQDFDAYHASPPCQAYSMAGQQWREAGKKYPDLIVPIRELLIATGKPYVIENVPGAPLINPVILNGAMFQLRVRRKRLFECSFDVPFFLLPGDERSNFRMGRPVKDGDMITPVGHFSNVPYAQKEMDINWMGQKELAQAIPPAYTEFIGRELMKALGL